MSPASFSLILTGVLLNAAAQLLLKAGTNAIGHFEFQWRNIVPIGWQVASEPHILGGLACYGISVVVWIMALSRVPVSMAYPMLSIGYVVNAMAAYWLLGESLPALRVAGIFVVILGVFLIARS
ncbi:MAG: EamA family transporter [Betaproteobacteria bacterium]|nr:EamA family transporter [Betaproteobacteria bacterium]MDE2211502.1 EamA family transporter [Betaproteobacteria bacterium]MDE2480507.1 EamA family transporter [Betaproteobacteria bacterium]MDE2625140.1 EamA family transporter [Betaproteobacteria bacterium]